MKLSFALPLVAAAALGLSATAPAQFGKPSKRDQVTLGQRAAQEVRQKEPVLPSSDPRVQTVRRVAQRLLAQVDDRNEPWEYSFDVINKNQVNAFALPGGPMFIYTGLLDRMKSEDELAGVLAHEIAHVRREHWAYAYRDRQQRNLGVSLLMVLTRANRTVGDLAGLGAHVFMDLPHSRNAELQADDFAFDTMIKSGYNPQGLADLFITLRSATQGGKPPEWLSTHPADASRIARIETRIREARGSYPPIRPLAFASNR
jgi:beta-barrel assembly-enhancing protease